jgi:hypothetical protein
VWQATATWCFKPNSVATDKRLTFAPRPPIVWSLPLKSWEDQRVATTLPANRPRGRPPRTIPGHMVRVRMDLPLWDTLAETARKEGTTASEVLRDAAERYVRRYRKRRKTR